jgi:predicted PurR-regulated permease PerM
MNARLRTAAPGEVFYARTFALISLFILGWLSYRILIPMYAALAWAAFIAFLLHPLQIRLTRLMRGHTNISAGLLTLFAVLIILGPLTGLTAAFVGQAEEVLKLAQRLASDQAGAQSSVAAGSSWLDSVLASVQRNIGISPAQVREWATEGARNTLGTLAAMSGKIFVGALGTALGFTISIFVVFFLLRDGARMVDTVRDLIPMQHNDKDRLFDHLNAVIHAVIYGTVLTAIIQGALLGIAFATLGLPAPVVVGVVGALLALLPVVGTPLIWVPAVIALAVQGRWVAAIILLAWGLFIVTIDNFLRPVLVSGRAPIGTLTVFIGVIGGASAFGTIGLFLGPVVLSMVMALARFTLEMRQPHTDMQPTLSLPPEQKPHQDPF